jgi:hypothetical protein
MTMEEILEQRRKMRAVQNAKREIEQNAPTPKGTLEECLNFLSENNYEPYNKIMVYGDQSTTRFFRLYRKYFTEDSRKEETMEQQESISYFFLIIVVDKKVSSEKEVAQYKKEILDGTYAFRDNIPYCRLKQETWFSVHMDDTSAYFKN